MTALMYRTSVRLANFGIGCERGFLCPLKQAAPAAILPMDFLLSILPADGQLTFQAVEIESHSQQIIVRGAGAEGSELPGL